MNTIIAIYIASIIIILLSMTYVVYTMYKSHLMIKAEGFVNSNTNKEKVSIKDYSVQEIENFLTPEECDHIISISTAHLEPSLVYSDTSDVHDTSSRKSEQAWLKDEMDPVVASISKKIAEASRIPIENQEDLQVVSYMPGGFFTPHYDACDGAKDYCERMEGHSGSRFLTYLIYLNDDYEGGETSFPKLNITVKPKKGKCVVFQSTLPPPDGRIILEALHGGNPVKLGNKWVCNKWIHNQSYIPPSSVPNPVVSPLPFPLP